jgi:hypothetical protein
VTCGRRPGKNFLTFAALVGCGHVSGLLMRQVWPLALMAATLVKGKTARSVAADFRNKIYQNQTFRHILTQQLEASIFSVSWPSGTQLNDLQIEHAVEGTVL